jgi:hypothetical protein
MDNKQGWEGLHQLESKAHWREMSTPPDIPAYFWCVMYAYY